MHVNYVYKYNKWTNKSTSLKKCMIEGSLHCCFTGLPQEELDNLDTNIAYWQLQRELKKDFANLMTISVSAMSFPFFLPSIEFLQWHIESHWKSTNCVIKYLLMSRWINQLAIVAHFVHFKLTRVKSKWSLSEKHNHLLQESLHKVGNPSACINLDLLMESGKEKVLFNCKISH